MARIRVCIFVSTTFLLTSNTFAHDRGCGYGTSHPPVSCGTVISNGCVSRTTSCPPVGCGTVVSCWCDSSGTNCPPVDYSTAVNNGCASCSVGAYQSEGLIAGGDVNTGSGSNASSGGIAGSGDNAGSGAIETGGGSVTGGRRLDPDVLTGQTGGPLGQQNINVERIWTDSSGKHKRLARFVRIEGTQVVLQSAQGRTTRVDVQNLSIADQLFVDQLRQTSMKGAFPSNKQPRIASRS